MFGFSYHPLRELPEAVFSFLLIQCFLCPFLDKGVILDLLPPIGFLPNGVRESTHPHFYNLTPASHFGQVAKSQSDKGKPHRSWVFLVPTVVWVFPGPVVERVGVVAVLKRVVVQTVRGGR